MPQGPSAFEPVVVRGRIGHGDGRGRRLGVPTANLAIGEEADPADGVYAGVYVRPDRSRWPTAVSVGRRASFHAGAALRLVEAHLIGFSGDLYGEAAEVHLLVPLRPQRTFASADELAVQLQRDIRHAAEALALADQ
jgi:riboflavin kinase/FMN adenylyltransferase